MPIKVPSPVAGTAPTHSSSGIGTPCLIGLGTWPAVTRREYSRKPSAGASKSRPGGGFRTGSRKK